MGFLELTPTELYSFTPHELNVVIDTRLKQSNPNYLTDDDISYLLSALEDSDDEILINHPLLAEQ